MEALVILLLGLVIITPGIRSHECPEVPEPGYFYYFAFGSNLLLKRMHINCPTATQCTLAHLPNYRLDFNLTVARWNGAVATIVADNDASVWGNFAFLNRQEGVDQGWYHAKNVTVTLRSGKNVTSRVYIENYPLAEKVEPEQIPKGRRPSKTYYLTVLLGAINSGLPVEYLNYIQRFPTNGKIAHSPIRQNLGYPFSDNSFP